MKTLNILFVEDEAGFNQTITRKLLDYDFKVTSVYTYKDAIKETKHLQEANKKNNVLITDFDLGEKTTGMDIIKETNNLFGKIILQTGTSESAIQYRYEDYEELVSKLGINYIFKADLSKKILGVLDEYLKSQK
ncbi:MAG: hypothetical protein PHE43_01015 [Candidatus Nanoarchaeia archaeon]|nr:hypothetical protein [Candidatus Nanoarchaeia archaeon]